MTVEVAVDGDICLPGSKPAKYKEGSIPIVVYSRF